jgi:predicted transcriptional regulator
VWIVADGDSHIVWVCLSKLVGGFSIADENGLVNALIDDEAVTHSIIIKLRDYKLPNNLDAISTGLTSRTRSMVSRFRSGSFRDVSICSPVFTMMEELL